MQRYLVVYKGTEGCDYSIGCGYAVGFITADDATAAVRRITEELAADGLGVAAADGYHSIELFPLAGDAVPVDMDRLRADLDEARR